MKIILVGLLLVFLAVQESTCKSYYLSDMEKPKARLQPSPRASVNDINMMNDMFRNLYEDIGKLKAKFEDLLYGNSQNDLEDDFGGQDVEIIEPNKPEESFEDTENTPKDTKREKIGSKYYYIDHTDLVNWSDAYHKCRQLGGNLAALENREELLALSEKLTRNNYWLNWTECVNLKKRNAGAAFSYFMQYDECESKYNFICENDQIEEEQDQEHILLNF